MGNKDWLSAVKKVVRSSYLKKKKEKRSHKPKSPRRSSCHGTPMSLDTCLSQTQPPLVTPPQHYPENEEQIIQQELPCSIVNPTPMAEEQQQQEAAETASQSSPSFLGKPSEEFAADKIQAAYCGYLTRKAVLPLRAEKRLKLVIEGQAAKQQTESTLMSLQTMARVQSQLQNRKIKMSQVNEALRQHKLQKRQKDQPKEWDLSPRSKEQVEASLRRKKEAAERREKALAYIYSQQTWRKSLKSANSNPNGTYWGWSWSERWDGVRPWETEANSESVSCQSPSTPSSKKSASLKRSVYSPVTSNSKGSTKTMKVDSGKKGISKTGLKVGSPKKQTVS